MKYTYHYTAEARINNYGTFKTSSIIDTEMPLRSEDTDELNITIAEKFNRLAPGVPITKADVIVTCLTFLHGVP